jgi:hypothetical protein
MITIAMTVSERSVIATSYINNKICSQVIYPVSFLAFMISGLKDCGYERIERLVTDTCLHLVYRLQLEYDNVQLISKC